MPMPAKLVCRWELDERVKHFRGVKEGNGRTSSDRVPTLVAARRSLHSRVEQWYREAPGVLSLVKTNEAVGVDDDFEEDLDDVEIPQHGPEGALLGLPSALDVEGWESLEVQFYGEVELRLRIGHAYDLLSSVRTSLRKKGVLIQDKDRNAHGTKDNLRSQQRISCVQSRIMFLARSYNSNFDKMQHLATSIHNHCSSPPLCEGDVTRLPSALHRIDVLKDLHVPSLHAPRNLGDSKRIISWIYQVAGPDTQMQEDWEKESEYCFAHHVFTNNSNGFQLLESIGPDSGLRKREQMKKSTFSMRKLVRLGKDLFLHLIFT